MDIKLIDQIYKFVLLLSEAKTMLIGTWDREKIQNCIKLATEVVFDLSDIKNNTEYKKHIFNKLVEKIKETTKACDVEKTIPTIDEIFNSQRLLYRTLLTNPYLSFDILAYVIETYDGDIKKRIVEDVTIGSKPAVTADVLTEVQMTLLGSASYLRSINHPTNARDNNIMSLLKEEYSFKLLPKTISYRAAAKLLIRDCSRDTTEGGLPQYNKYLIIKNFSEYINKSPQNMEILFHAYIITLETRERYLDKGEREPIRSANMYGPLLDYILSIVDEKPRLPYLEVNTAVLEPKIWILHPWMLAKISYYDETFYLKYRNKLIECVRQEQKLMINGTLSPLIIKPKMFYRQNHVHKGIDQIDCEMMEKLLRQWNILVNIFDKKRADKLVDFLKKEWIMFKEYFTSHGSIRNSDRIFKDMFMKVWTNFFKELGVRVEEPSA
ncbi:uncharacterized protein OCT59_026284 [Rhizophagus irregularis]|uniref:Uncharacterized protein n=3 Tax=Rhizophagus irregularis TaxID=588596 RepID=A0A915ZM78_9GLOM|nr:hypothetical protein OCT59_026284 [Rhizophagus irregularis]CAB4488891.1 unnamed protein product [Rhizophagus irregularis]CAB5379706.1 unnamed protein product [Rhizophagus irregularis]CAG8752076.1 6801_t:CDS:2 [Rhizophagus irregularis]